MNFASDSISNMKRVIRTEMSGFDDWTEYWLFRLMLNLIGYASVFIPLWIIIRTIRRKGLTDKIESLSSSGHPFYRFLALCLIERSPQDQQKLEDAQPKSSRSTARTFGLLIFCFCGLQLSYLTWGVLQEKAMTKRYDRLGTEGETKDKFKDSQFLVFMNRISAFIIAGIYIMVFSERQPNHSSPLFKYSYASFSNIMSSWFQYEALKFITFPTQVLGKASKIIPVMLMGKLVSKKTYPVHQYVTAFFISAGISIFLLSRGVEGHHNKASVVETTTLSGFILMAGYLTFDSFTSNWQGALFSQYRMSSMQMMCGVNLFSSLFTFVSLLEQGTLFQSFSFLLNHEYFVRDVVMLSFCSAIGQLFIFYTISQFGAVTFTIIMTIRQALAILLSCIIYGHEIGPIGMLGIILTFVAIFLKIYLNQTYRKKQIKGVGASNV